MIQSPKTVANRPNWKQEGIFQHVIFTLYLLRFVFFMFFFPPSLDIFSLARHHLGLLLTIYLFLVFFILWLQEEQSQRDIEKDESSINRFSAFVWQSVIRRRAEINGLGRSLGDVGR